VLRYRRGHAGPEICVPGTDHGHRFQRWHARAGVPGAPGRRVGTRRRPGPALRRGLRPGGQLRRARALPAYRTARAVRRGVPRPAARRDFRLSGRCTAAGHLRRVWALLGFDLAMRVRNAVWHPPFVMYYRTCPLHAVLNDLTGSGFTVTTVPLTELGQREGGCPRYRLVLARKATTP